MYQINEFNDNNINKIYASSACNITLDKQLVIVNVVNKNFLIINGNINDLKLLNEYLINGCQLEQLKQLILKIGDVKLYEFLIGGNYLE